MNTSKPTTASKAAYTGDIPNTPFGFITSVSSLHRTWMIIATIVVIVGAVGNATIVLLVGQVVEKAEAGLIQEAVFFGFMYPVSVFVLQCVWRLSGYFGLLWVRGIRADSYNVLTQYIYQHSHSYFIDRFAGSILSKVGNVVNSVERLAMDFMWHHTEAFVTLLTTAVIILFIDLYSGLIFILLVLTLVFINLKMIKKKQVLSMMGAESDTKLRGELVDVFANVSAMRQYASRGFELLKFRRTIEDNTSIYTKGWMYSELMRIVNSVVLLIFSIVMFWFLSVRWENGEISTGEFITVMVIILNLSSMLIFIGRIFNDTAKAYGQMEEGLQDIFIQHEIVDVPDAPALRTEQGIVNWTNVQFEFGENKVFKDFNLKIEPRQRVGLVGPSGAGKTTFVSLLLRQHDINGGVIEIDGQNIAQVTQDSLRQNVAVVPQEPLLFHRTIRENIAYGKPDATQSEIRAVAAKAQALDFILDLPEKFDTLVGERGVKLSGGQKQRVAIARAMLKNAPILVLDEATSALDSESEVLIQKALHELMEGKTVVAIAHRLSTLREMDRIIVLEGGKIVEDGTHDELAQSNGTYARLWEHQAGGFLQE